MSQSTMSEQFRILKQYIEQKDYDNFNGFLDNNDISKKTLNSLLCLTLQIYRSNFQMTDYIELLIAKGAEQNSMFDEQKPRTATVQVVLARGDKLDQNTVKAITNLLLGSVSELEAENIAVTDTNGDPIYNEVVA